MAEVKIIKFKNLTPLHVGSGKENYDFSATNLQSDTLSSALTAVRAQNGKGDDALDFISSFTISSAFPYWKNSYFLPKPKGRLAVDVQDEEEHQSRKLLKKVEFLELPIWSEIIQGKKLTVAKRQLQDDFLVGASTDFKKFTKAQTNQRVSVPRGTDGVAEPFFFEWVFFHSEGGLYCIVDAEEELFTEIILLFEQLGETGLGTDKNIGGGKFEVETAKIILPEIEDATHNLLLSLYIPLETELSNLNLQQAKYELILRGGYMAGSTKETFRHLRKKSIYMFDTGSAFPTTETLKGKVVNLKPDWNDESMHPVFRSGKPFYLPVKIDDYE